MKVIIIGGGVIGVTSAYYLGKLGYQVIVIDKEEKLGMATTFANGGQLSYSHVDPLANSSIFSKLPKLVLGMDPAFRMKLSIQPDFIKWLALFLRNCTHSKDCFNTENLLRLSLFSQQQLLELQQQLEMNFDYRKNGKLICYSHSDDKRTIVKKLNFKRQLGVDQKLLSRSECIELEPSSASMPDLSFGVFAEMDEAGDALQFTQTLANFCEKEFGAEFLLGKPVEELIASEGKIAAVRVGDECIEANAFVVAAGSYSKMLCKPLNINLPICSLKGYSITVPATPAAPDISLTDMKNKMVYCRLGDRLRIAGIAELGNNSLAVSPKYIEALLAMAQRTLPDAGDYTQLLDTWSGLRPSTPDSAPIIGETPISNLFCNTGHGMFGWTLACGSGALLGDVISGKQPRSSLIGLGSSRF